MQGYCESSSQCSPFLCKVSQQVFETFCYEKARQMLAKVYILHLKPKEISKQKIPRELKENGVVDQFSYLS